MTIYQVATGLLDVVYFASERDAVAHARQEAKEMFKDELIHVMKIVIPGRMNKTTLLSCLNGDIASVANNYTICKSVRGRMNVERTRR
jgi:hypothetical protein